MSNVVQSVSRFKFGVLKKKVYIHQKLVWGDLAVGAADFLLPTTSSPSRGNGFFFFGRLLGSRRKCFTLADQFGHKGFHPDDDKHQYDEQSSELGRGASWRSLVDIDLLDTETIDKARIYITYYNVSYWFLQILFRQQQSGLKPLADPFGLVQGLGWPGDPQRRWISSLFKSWNFYRLHGSSFVGGVSFSRNKLIFKTNGFFLNQSFS